MNYHFVPPHQLRWQRILRILLCLHNFVHSQTLLAKGKLLGFVLMREHLRCVYMYIHVQDCRFALA